MKKITFLTCCFLIALFTTSYGQEASLTTWAETNQVPIRTNVNKFDGIEKSINQKSISNDLNTKNGGVACTVGVYLDRAIFDSEAGVLPTEDFTGGPTALTGCDDVISSAGDSCYPAGEILPGVEITINTPGNGTVYIDPADGFGNSIPVVGSNTFTDFTIINFPNNDVTSFGFDLYSLLTGSFVEIRIFGLGGLIDTINVDVTSTGPSFFGYIAPEIVTRVELEDLSGGDVEVIGNLSFGDCSGGVPFVCTGVNTQYDSTAVPFDIDGPGTSTTDCAGAPNLVPVTVTGMGTIGVDSAIDNVTLDISHTWSGDLTISLVSPSGTELILSDANSGNTDDAYNGTMFQDGGADITAASAPYGVGPYEPQGGTFAAMFDGEDIMGDWNLKICDNVGGDTGTVNSFSITICGPVPVTNDVCAGATPLICGDIVAGDTSDNTDTGGNAAPDEWYSFTGTGTSELVTVSLCNGTAYDSLIRVFDACGGNEIAVNDDACGLQSELTFTSDGTSTYLIMIEGFGSSSGTFNLEITCAQPPVNDDCSNALPITCGDTVVGTTINATIDDTVAPTCDTGVTSPGVWYTFTDASGLVSDVTITMCSGAGGADYDSKLSVYTGDCGAPPLTCVVGNDDTCGLQSEVTFQSDGSTTYYVLVHGFGGATGNFTLEVNCTPIPPSNDLIANSLDLDAIGACPDYTDTAVAFPAATLEGGNPVDCNIDGVNGVWYNITVDGDGFLFADIVTPAGISVVNFYEAPNESAVESDLTLVHYVDNQCAPHPTASIPVVAGTTYYLFVANTGGISDVHITCSILGVQDNAIEGFNFYPNPTDNVLNMEAVNTIEKVSVFNVLGQKVIDLNVDATTSQIDVSNLTTGTYFMKVTVAGQTGTYKILKK